MRSVALQVYVATRTGVFLLLPVPIEVRNEFREWFCRLVRRWFARSRVVFL